MNNSHETQLGTLPIGKLMLRLALPSVVAQLINLLYNMVDRMYIGRIPEVGSLALTGVGVTFPIIMIISAFSAFAGGGGAPLRQSSSDAAIRNMRNRFSATAPFCCSAFPWFSPWYFRYSRHRCSTCSAQVTIPSPTLWIISQFMCLEAYLFRFLSD